MTLLMGLITGILAGFLMQKGRVIRYDKQIAAMRLKDMTILKFMLSASVTASVGIYLLSDLGVIELSVKTTILGANIIGGLIFGVGWALVGYCPGTAAAAIGEGRWDAIWGVLGMLLGASVFAAFYPAVKRTILTWGDLGKLTLPSVLHVNHWFVIAAFVIGAIFLFRWFEGRDL